LIVASETRGDKTYILNDDTNEAKAMYNMATEKNSVVTNTNLTIYLLDGSNRRNIASFSASGNAGGITLEPIAKIETKELPDKLQTVKLSYAQLTYRGVKGKVMVISTPYKALLVTSIDKKAEELIKKAGALKEKPVIIGTLLSAIMDQGMQLSDYNAVYFKNK